MLRNQKVHKPAAAKQQKKKNAAHHKKSAAKPATTQQKRAFRATKSQRAYKFNTTFGLTEEQIMFQETAKAFADAEMAPFAHDWDETKTFPKATIKKAAELGFASLYVGEEVGGLGLGRKDGSIIFEALATGDIPSSAYITIHNMCSAMIYKHGTEEQRQKWNPSLATLDTFSSYCLTEPGAGSDASSLQTKATKDGDDYILNGSKCFISGGGVSDLYVVMARTGGPGPKGISAFLVENGTPGLTFGPNEKKMGWNCSPTAMVNFDDVRVPKENLLGGVEGQGFKWALGALSSGRVSISSLSLGGAQVALDRAIEYTKERKQFGKPLNENQWVQFTLADCAAKLTAARMMVHRAAEMIDENHPEANIHSAMAKKFATETCSEIADKCLQLHGGYGYLKDFPLERIVRDLRVNQILEGTNQIMNVIVSRAITEP